MRDRASLACFKVFEILSFAKIFVVSKIFA
jgi:hypothetical protein